VGGVFGAGDCLVGGDPCVLGTCTAYKSSFCDGTECVASDYATPAVAIATLPGNAAALANELAGLPDPPETALTPTSVAVKVGVDIAKQHATAHPDHAVVVVLATDGLPTRCAPLDIGGIATLASAGVTGTPSIKTFVIGVFSDEEKATATTNLNAIATGGGTGTAFMVSTGANVTADFQAALNVIRATSLPCEYAVPTSDSGTPDYEKVNVQFTGGGKSEVLGYEKDAAGCDPQSGGWYYDTDPAKGGTPTKITLCPATCDAVKHTAGDAKVDILLGCKTIVK
jgi:hypothetical protein